MLTWIGLADGAWRALLLLALGVAPYASPVESVGARTAAVATVRVALFGLAILGLTVAVRRYGRRHVALAAFSAALAAALPVVSAIFSGGGGPLARGAWIVTPLVWCTIASALAGPVASRVESWRKRPLGPSTRRASAVAALVVGAASLTAAAPRLSSRATLWRNALAINPGDEFAAVAVADDLRSKHDDAGALATLSTCTRLRAGQCRCAVQAATLAIDLGRYADARGALDRSSTCTANPRRIALGAEASIGMGALSDGQRAADVAVALDPNDAHAVYARAWAEMLRRDTEHARADAQRAVDLGRGEPASILLGLLLFGSNDLAGAEAQFRAALAASPDDARAVYDLALVADRRQQYHDAREGYLRALRLDPQMADARYNLAVLTFSRGAVQEAQHDVEEFAARYPNDPRIVQLRRMLASPPPRTAMTMGQ